VTDNGNGRGATDLILFRSECPSLPWRDPQQREILGRSQLAQETIRCTPSGQDEILLLESGEVLEQTTLVPPVEVVRIGDRSVVPCVFVHGPYEHELLGLFERHGAQKYAVHHAENGGVRTYAEGNDETSDRSEAGTFPHHPGCETQILKKIHDGTSCCLGLCRPHLGTIQPISRAAKFDLEERFERQAETMKQFLPCLGSRVGPLSIDELGQMSTIELELHRPGVLAPAAACQDFR